MLPAGIHCLQPAEQLLVLGDAARQRLEHVMVRVDQPCTAHAARDY